MHFHAFVSHHLLLDLFHSLCYVIYKIMFECLRTLTSIVKGGHKPSPLSFPIAIKNRLARGALNV